MRKVHDHCLPFWNAVTDFVDTYPDARSANIIFREIMVAAFSSKAANVWDEHNRTEKMFFFEQVADIIEKMFDAVDGQVPCNQVIPGQDVPAAPPKGRYPDGYDVADDGCDVVEDSGVAFA